MGTEIAGAFVGRAANIMGLSTCILMYRNIKNARNAKQSTEQSHYRDGELDARFRILLAALILCPSKNSTQ